MRNIIGIVLALTTSTGASTFAQGTAAPPKPGPEHAKLAALVGNWTTEVQSTENPFGPAEKCVGGRITSEWFDGHFAVVRHVQGRCSVSGETRELDVITYDAASKTYTWYLLDNRGTAWLGKGSMAADTLTMTWEVLMKGKNYKIRGTGKGLGTNKFAWTAEYSEDGRTWKAFFHSTDTKSK